MGKSRMQQERKLAGSCFEEKGLVSGLAGISGKLLTQRRGRARKWSDALSLSAVPISHRALDLPAA